MDTNSFSLPPYALEKAIRHGPSIERLIKEREQGVGEFADQSLASALAFDAADFIWAALMLYAPTAQQTREVRNAVAEAIISSLKTLDGLPSE